MIIISEKYTCEKSNWESIEGIYLGYPYKVHHGGNYISIPVDVVKVGASYVLAHGKAMCDRYHGEATDTDVENAEAALRGYAAAMAEIYNIHDSYHDLQEAICMVENFLCEAACHWDDVEPATI